MDWLEHLDDLVLEAEEEMQRQLPGRPLLAPQQFLELKGHHSRWVALEGEEIQIEGNVERVRPGISGLGMLIVRHPQQLLDLGRSEEVVAHWRPVEEQPGALEEVESGQDY
jgi:hypothetical protein